MIISVYLGLMITSCLALWAAGMPFFDAVNHSFSIAATGGFSSRNLSIAAFDSVLIDVVSMIFMAVAAIHFGLLYAMVVTRSFKPLNNAVVKYYFASILVATLIIVFSLVSEGGYTSWGRAFLDAGFNVVSYMSTTGFANCDNSGWPWLAAVVLIFVSFHCGCSGSTTGGIKIDRLLISFKALGTEIRRRLHPSSVSQVRLGGHFLPDSTVSAVMMFIVVYVLVIFASVVLVMMFGTSASDAVTGVIASVGSVGPGVGELGSLDNYTSQLVSAKVIYTFDMFLGRLEIYPVLVVDNPVYTMKGMRNLLEYMMRKECTNRGIRSNNIKPLVVVDVAALKLYADYINASGLIAVFENYYKHVGPQGQKVREDLFETLISFSEFMKSKPIQNMGIVFNRIIREAKPVLQHYNT